MRRRGRNADPLQRATLVVGSSPPRRAPGCRGCWSSTMRQLDAMQKEIDSLSLPSDDDFSDAADAVYQAAPPEAIA